MQEGLLLALFGRTDGDVGQIVGQGLGHAKEHQTHAHARGKQHGQPGQHAEFGFFLVIAQLDAAQAADGEDHQKADEDRECQDVEPAEVGEDVGFGGVQQDLGPFGSDEDHGDQRHDEQQCHRNDEGIERRTFLDECRQRQIHPPPERQGQGRQVRRHGWARGCCAWRRGRRHEKARSPNAAGKQGEFRRRSTAHASCRKMHGPWSLFGSSRGADA